MTKKTIGGAELNDLRDILDSKPDYSPAFTRRVASLAYDIQGILSAPVKHDPDMNYSSAQKIVISLSSTCQPVPFGDDRTKYRLSVYVSSKGPYFAVVVLKLSAPTAGWEKLGLAQPGQYWIQVAEDGLSAKLKDFRRRIVSIMAAQHYGLVENSILSQGLGGRITEMGHPATVFDVLFSEVY